MEKRIENFINSTDFGNGSATYNAYSTAWVARIYNRDRTGPAFPQSVDYIRRNQLSDGSWGAKKPFLIFDRIVSTLIAVICLKQWNDEEDRHIIEKGTKFITKNLFYLADLNEIKSKFTAGFELILPALIDESKQYELEFGSEKIIQEYRDEKERKVKKIKYCEQFNRDVPGFGSWYFSLEGLSSLYKNQEIERMIACNGLICGCYSATAFALFRGIESKHSFERISYEVSANQGAVTTVCRMRVFDLAWSLNFLYFSGYPIGNKNLEIHIERLALFWEKNRGLVGGSPSGLPPDADDISNTLLILKLTDRLTDNESAKSLLRFLRVESNKREYFITYEAEVQPSLTTNINCLIALNQFKDNKLFGETADKVFEWTKNYIIENNYSFEDKWHLSQFYGMSRALLAFMYHDLKFSEKIFRIILLTQNQDGGWGTDGSTAVESAYIIIAINHWLRYSNRNLESVLKGEACLQRAAEYMTMSICDDIPNFWIDKTLYTLYNIDKLAIMCARYALDHPKF